MIGSNCFGLELIGWEITQVGIDSKPL